MNQKTIPTVRELMTRDVITLRPDMTMSDAISILLRYRISGAPVINKDREVVGILSEKDCLRLFTQSAYEQTPIGCVRDYMSTDVKVLKHDIDLFGIAGIFFQHSFRRMPVVENGKLIGLISRPDVLKGALALDENLKGGRGSTQFMTDEIISRLAD